MSECNVFDEAPLSRLETSPRQTFSGKLRCVDLAVARVMLIGNTAVELVTARFDRECMTCRVQLFCSESLADFETQPSHCSIIPIDAFPPAVPAITANEALEEFHRLRQTEELLKLGKESPQKRGRPITREERHFLIRIVYTVGYSPLLSTKVASDPNSSRSCSHRARIHIQQTDMLMHTVPAVNVTC